jgi:enoyl-CoA hydratase
MSFEQIEYRPGKVARIIFNRPNYLNAQSYQLLAEFDRALAEAVADPKCGAIVLSGAGRAFCAGHDLGTEEEIRYCKEHNLSFPGDGNLPKKVADMHVWFVQKTLEWRNCPKPTVALVHGYCIYAGWMLAAAMDVVFAAEDALFLPGLVEYFSVPWELGPRKAKEILMEHRFITAAEALEYGFVNRIYPADQLEAEALAYAGRIADNYLSAPAWIGTIKATINHMEDAMGFSAEIESAYTSFCMMFGLGAHTASKPEDGGFARTKIARKNFEATQDWLKKRGL